MENRAYAIAVGLFTLILGSGLVLAYWWIHGAHESTADYVVVSRLPVLGLNTEAKVRFRGVDVGKVTQISFDPASQTTILVKITVDQNLKLSTGSYAELRLQGLTGLAYIDINDESTSAPQLPVGGSIPLQPSFVDKLMAQGPEMVGQFQTLLESSNRLTQSLDRVLAGIDARKLNRTITNLEEASSEAVPAMKSATVMFGNMSKLAEDNQAQIAKSLESIQRAADDARPAMNELAEASRAFRGAANQLAANVNQLGSTLEHETLPQLYATTQHFDRSAHRFDQFLDFIEENPQSLIFGNPILLPGPGEKGFEGEP